MGRASRSKIDPAFTKKAFGGRITAKELWRQTVLPGKFCLHCRTAPAIGTINMFSPAADFQKDHPRLALQYATECGGRIPYVQFNVNGEARNFVALPVLYFCGLCRKDMEKFAAHKPSYVVAEIRTGPEVDKVFSQVPR
jgi:hypothetical protein